MADVRCTLLVEFVPSLPVSDPHTFCSRILRSDITRDFPSPYTLPKSQRVSRTQFIDIHAFYSVMERTKAVANMPVQ